LDNVFTVKSLIVLFCNYPILNFPLLFILMDRRDYAVILVSFIKVPVGTGTYVSTSVLYIYRYFFTGHGSGSRDLAVGKLEVN
jgi:hypothetical protein